MCKDFIHVSQCDLTSGRKLKKCRSACFHGPICMACLYLILLLLTSCIYSIVHIHWISLTFYSYSLEQNRILWFSWIFLIVVWTFQCVLTRALVSSACDGHLSDDSCVLDYFGVWNISADVQVHCCCFFRVWLSVAVMLSLLHLATELTCRSTCDEFGICRCCRLLHT